MLKPIHATDWIALILLVEVGLVAFLRHYFPARFLAFIKLPVNTTYFTEFAQEKEQPFWFSRILETVMIISISLFIYALLYIHDEHTIAAADYIIFIKIVLIAVLIAMAQRFLHSLTGLLFNMPKSFSMWMHVKDAYLHWASLLLIVATTLAIFSQIDFTIIMFGALAVLAILYIIGVAKGSALLSDSKTLSGLHIFFYLCTLEILPVCVLVKMLA